MEDTAYVKSSKGWMYCEDSRVSKAQEHDVVVSFLLRIPVSSETRLFLR